MDGPLDGVRRGAARTGVFGWPNRPLGGALAHTLHLVYDAFDILNNKTMNESIG